MPGNQIDTQTKNADSQQTDTSVANQKSIGSPVLSSSSFTSVKSSYPGSPAIYDLTGKTRFDIEDSAKKVRLLGFNAILVDGVDEIIVQAARSHNLLVFLNLNLSKSKDEELIASNPDWFFNSETGVRFNYLSDQDRVVTWWIDQIKSLILNGVNGFMFLEAAETPSFVWQRILPLFRQQNPGVQFIASTLGSEVTKIRSLYDCAFSFSISSSCWWDYSAGWLNADTQRLIPLAPPISLAVPPDNPFPVEAIFRQRALTLAAVFGAGWLMPAGLEIATDYDLSAYVEKLNHMRRFTKVLQSHMPAIVVSSPGSKIALLDREKTLLLAVNPSSEIPTTLDSVNEIYHPSQNGVSYFNKSQNVVLDDLTTVTVEPCGTEIFDVRIQQPISIQNNIKPDCNVPRIAIERISPKVDGGQFPVRRIVGQSLFVEADILIDGHDKLKAEILYRPMTNDEWQAEPMELMGNDRWSAKIPLNRLGRYLYAITAWRDTFGTLVEGIKKKKLADLHIETELADIIKLIKKIAENNKNGCEIPLRRLLTEMSASPQDEQWSCIQSAEMTAWVHAGDSRDFEFTSENIIVDSERIAARFASWFEIFPRSQGNHTDRHGTFLDTMDQIPRIAAMGFDILYFPPIHPIGNINRKGRNNSLIADRNDPGSPYAIGSEHGGHDAIHPELGTFEDFESLITKAKDYGIEIALDFAIQCAPDHPWVRQHKGWFDWRSDGSLKYAENPPKRYEDIVNVDFYADQAKPALWLALRDIVQFWINRGIKIFRVDNPHTKPFPFWEWMINDIRQRHPETIFLAEAFTRPKIMYLLAKIGFSQSYTYFTWRNTKSELEDYLIELTTTEVKEFFRPHFFANTPDINPKFLQNSGPPGFLIRAALAATLSGLWGIYNGFEFCESEAIAGKEEYLNSEKYQIRKRDLNATPNIVEEISRLNGIRRNNTALQSHLGVRFHRVLDEQVIFFSKTGPDGNFILVVVSLDPFNTHKTIIELPMDEFGLSDDGELSADDLMRDYQFTWYGRRQEVILHPNQPFAIWRIQPVKI